LGAYRRNGVHYGGAPRRAVVREAPLLYSTAMPALVTATVSAQGPQADLDAYRQRLNELLADDFDGAMKELHIPGCLEYALSTSAGLPFPALVAASLEVPDLVIAIAWRSPAHGTAGTASIQGGALKRSEESRIETGAQRVGVDVRAAADGTLALALACRRDGADWIGYAVTAGEHAFFRVRPGPMLEATDGVELQWAERWRIAGDRALYAELDPREPLDAALGRSLGALADDFAGEWLWFAADDPVETAVERQRFGDQGYRVSDANLRTARLRGLEKGADGALTFSSLDDDGRAIAALVARHWLATERH
jgi:hypothetical protein